MEAFKTTACGSKVGFSATDLPTEFKKTKKRKIRTEIRMLLSTPSALNSRNGEKRGITLVFSVSKHSGVLVVAAPV